MPDSDGGPVAMAGRKIVLLAFGKRMWMGRARSSKVRRMLRILNIYIITTAGGYGSGHRPRDLELSQASP